MTLWAVLLIILLFVAIAAIPAWPYNRGWGFSPVGIVLAAFLFVILLWALGFVELRGAEEAVDGINDAIGTAEG
ncbi:MAG TPA: DUF3309 family protein [Thermomicrobiales bacterium]|nr:DUF3309 family protein [Thermomicrobiales bacterium]